jgi:hypothetical protein
VKTENDPFIDDIPTKWGPAYVTRVDWENASNYNIHDTYNMFSWDL